MSAEAPAVPVTATTKTSSGPILLRRLVDLDIALSLWIHQACLPIPRCLLKTLEISGDGRFWFPIPISLFAFSSRSPILVSLILGSLLDLLLVALIKHLVRRPRPIYNKGMRLAFAVDHWSFPSGHSSRVFFIAAFLNVCADRFRLVFGSNRWLRGCFGGECHMPNVSYFLSLVKGKRSRRSRTKENGLDKGLNAPIIFDEGEGLNKGGFLGVSRCRKYKAEREIGSEWQVN